MEVKSAPLLSEYINVQLYLQDYYRFKKDSEAGFSYDSWAQSMDVKSRSYLRFAILGKRTISEELAQKFVKYINFGEVEKEYFFTLVLYSQAKQPEQKRIYGKRLTQILRTHVEVDEVAPDSGPIGNPLFLMVRNILSFTDSPRSADGLAKVLGLSVQEISDVLFELETAGFVEFNLKGWNAVHTNVKINDAPKNEAILSYHKLSLLKAIEAQQKPAEERSYRSLGLALSADEYREYLNDLDIFAKQIYAKYESDSIVNRKLYQINFNLFPWTETVST